LDEEVEHIAPEKMQVFEAKDITAMMDKMVAHARSNNDAFMTVPYMLR
jgi:hypothetical protein